MHTTYMQFISTSIQCTRNLSVQHKVNSIKLKVNGQHTTKTIRYLRGSNDLKKNTGLLFTLSLSLTTPKVQKKIIHCYTFSLFGHIGLTQGTKHLDTVSQ